MHTHAHTGTQAHTESSQEFVLLCRYKQTLFVCFCEMQHHKLPLECEILNSLNIPGDFFPVEAMGTVKSIQTLSLICCFQRQALPLVGLNLCLWNEKIHVDLVFTKPFGCRKQKSIWTHWNERLIKRNGHTSWTPWKRTEDFWIAGIIWRSVVWKHLINKVNMDESMHRWGSGFSNSSGVNSRDIGG